MTIATQATLTAVLAKLSADPATQTTLAALLTAAQAATPAGSNTIGNVGLNAGANSIGTVVNGAGTAYMGQVRLTDGTNNPAVKASTTAAGVADPALVVALSPNNYLAGISQTTGVPGAVAVTSTASTNLNGISGSPRNLFEVSISNPTASPVYWKAFNVVSTSVTVGTTVPILTIPVAATSTVCINFGVNGKRFGTAISHALTGAMVSTDTTATGAGVLIHLTYA